MSSCLAEGGARARRWSATAFSDGSVRTLLHLSRHLRGRSRSCDIALSRLTSAHEDTPNSRVQKLERAAFGPHDAARYRSLSLTGAAMALTCPSTLSHFIMDTRHETKRWPHDVRDRRRGRVTHLSSLSLFAGLSGRYDRVRERKREREGGMRVACCKVNPASITANDTHQRRTRKRKPIGIY